MISGSKTDTIARDLRRKMAGGGSGSWSGRALGACLGLMLALTGSALSTQPASAQAPASPALSQKSPDAQNLASTATQKGYVPIIVEFAGPSSVQQLSPDRATLNQVKAQIASLQQDIIASHFGSVASPTQGQGFDRALRLMAIRPMFSVNVTAAELNALAADPRITRIYPNSLAAPTLIQSVPLIGMANAYAAGATGANQAVAILDTGVQTNHEFLSSQIVAEACFSNGGGGATRVSLCPNGATSQIGTGASNAEVPACIDSGAQLCQHGTHVAGIAAGLNTNLQAGEPANGVAKAAKIVSIQVFTRFNDPADCRGNAPCVLTWSNDVISALDWVFENAMTPAPGVRMAATNMSLGGGRFTSTCDDDARKGPIDTLLSAGVVSAISSGNDGYVDAVGAPGCISTAVTVGSSTKADGISSFSNMSPVVDIMAPGTSILSSVPVVPSSLSAYASFNGTSMAAPHVAGAFAAIRSVCPNSSVAQILAALQNTGVTIQDNRSGGTLSRQRIQVDAAIQQLACSGGGPRVASHDFNGDSFSDILWRRNDGNLAIWLMNGLSPKSASTLGVIDTSWQIAGTGDFNGDGKVDALWRRSDGNLAIWLMNGFTVVNSATFGVIDTSWQIVGTGDFDGDGKADIVWRRSDGTLAVWLINGLSIKSTATFGAVDTSWQVSGVGDVDGDGNADLIWRRSDGNFAVWLMSGLSIKSTTTFGAVDTSWQVANTGDFDGDGKADVLWRRSDGNVAVWLMNGASLKNSATFGVTDLSWRISGTGDFNGDGKGDILWRNTSGTVGIWLLNGLNVASTQGVATVTTDWVIQK